MVDELFFCKERTVAATSNPAVLKRYPGGVMRNIARHLVLLGIPVQLITVLGNDPDGEWLGNDIKNNGIGSDAVLRVDDNTGKYASILDADGSLFVAACTDPCEKYLSPQFLQQQVSLLATASLIIADTNIGEYTLSWLAAFCREENIQLFVEPVSVAKARKLAHIDVSGIFMLTPNEDELQSLCNVLHHNVEECMEELFNRGVKNVWLREGEKGSRIFNKGITLSLHAPAISITDSTGAGDAALAGWVAACLWEETPLRCLQTGHSLAAEVLQVRGAVMQEMTKEKLFQSIIKYYPDEQ